MNENNWIDISATISDGMVSWPTDPPVQVHKVESIGINGAVANVTSIATTAHVGTHIDAPLHFIKNGADVASVDVNILIGMAKVFHVRNPKEISYADIKDYTIEKGDRVLFRTANSDTNWECMPFNENYIYLSTDAAEYLVNKEVRCIGIDYLSIGGNDNNPQVHKMLLGKPVIIIEGLKLGDIEAGTYEMICLPLKIKNSDGGPSRVVIRRML